MLLGDPWPVIHSSLIPRKLPIWNQSLQLGKFLFGAEELAQVRRMLALLAVSSRHREPAGDVQTGANDEADRFVAEMLRWGVLPKLAVGGTARQVWRAEGACS